MVVSNFVTDIQYFRIPNGFSGTAFWFYFARLVAFSFVFLAGLSMHLSYSKAKKSKTEKELRKKFLFRGLKIFCYGLLITAVTWIFLRRDFIAFGVLHLIGVSTVLAFPLLKRKKAVLIAGLTYIAVGLLLSNFFFDFSSLLWLGFVPKGYSSVDYFPLFPWFGVFLVGVFFGKILYPEFKRKFRLPDFSQNAFGGFVQFLGRHSLFIYLLHQPLILSALWLFGFASFA